MHKRYFLKLVRKHIKGIATPEEEQLLLSYYNLFELEPDVMALLNNEERRLIPCTSYPLRNNNSAK